VNMKPQAVDNERYQMEVVGTELTSSTRLKPWDSSRWGSRLIPNPHGGNVLLRRP